MDDPEKIIADTVARSARGTPNRIARAILDELWNAGYEIVPKRNLIPIRHNPGEGPAPSPYGEDAEAEARDMSPAELFRLLANEPKNAAIRDKIIEIARKLG